MIALLMIALLMIALLMIALLGAPASQRTVHALP